ncbi:hypothetical protein J6TS2_50830 [Heyndrickxia sporothermodurans]|nr:hypothetical protein J6TS2_50830 [Heyndrickxia sporothermodurans]
MVSLLKEIRYILRDIFSFLRCKVIGYYCERKGHKWTRTKRFYMRVEGIVDDNHYVEMKICKRCDVHSFRHPYEDDKWSV